MRLCPTVEGSAAPLITHRISADVCQTRQCANFHKCHRCIYRGKAASWEPAHPPLALMPMHDAEEPGIEVTEVDLGKPKKVVAAKAGASPKGKAAAKPAAGKPVAKAAEAAL